MRGFHSIWRSAVIIEEEYFVEGYANVYENDGDELRIHS